MSSLRSSPVLALLGLCLVGLCLGNSLMDEHFETIQAAIDACYSQDYEQAWNLLNQAKGQDPDDPAVLYWEAALVQMLCYDTGDKAMIDSFYRSSDRTDALCELRLAEDPDDTRAYFYQGMSRLNRANTMSWEQKKTAALRLVLKVPAPLQAALERDPELVDAYFGLGMVEYFRAQGDDKFLLGLGILGSKEKALKWVRMVAADSGLCQPTAWFMLAWILKEERRYGEALAECRKLLTRYPGNRTVLRTMRDAYLENGDLQEVLAVCRELEQGVRADFPDNRYYLSENWLKLAKAWQRLGQVDSALAMADRIIAWESLQNEVPWLPNYVREAKQLRRQLAQ